MGLSRWFWGAAFVLVANGLIIWGLGLAKPPHWLGISASLGIMTAVIQALFLVFWRYPFRDLSDHREDYGAVE